MTTPQEIREKSFDKARSMFGGYDMATIDEYLEDLANDFEALQKENVALKSKMKVLVDKIEEYRANESALNMAILSAQKLSVQIENDARSRSASIVSEAEAKAAALLGNIDDRIAQEEARLQAAKLSSAKFFESARDLCQKQLQTLDRLSSAARAEVGKQAEQIRIPKEQSAPVSEPSSMDSGNTQVFNFVKDEI
jgi:cell division initiation protein